ncbi:MAG: YdcF family protein [Nitrospirae bacterium]|nr:YdcF family protein [Nitrospirota bacterium]
MFEGRKAEAVIVKRLLIDLGVPSDKIIMEDKSRDTIENAKYTMEICKKLNYKKPILATSACHMKRAIMSFRKIGIDVFPKPANFKTWKNKRYRRKSYLSGSFEGARTAIHEYLGLLSYKFAY